MTTSKAWNWDQNQNPVWLSPSEECYAMAERWRLRGDRDLLDFGCGLGRHAIAFAQRGFRVRAFDLSQAGVAHLQAWAAREKLSVEVRVADMLALPYADRSFDCIFAYHVLSHTDTGGIRQILGEIIRVLRPGGEVYFTLCSKDTWSFRDAGYPKWDENTVVKTDQGPEQGLPHFYVTLDDIFPLLGPLEPLYIRHTDDCYVAGARQNSKHYFILARLGEAGTPAPGPGVGTCRE